MAKQFDVSGFDHQRSGSLLPGAGPKGHAAINHEEQLVAASMLAGEGLGAFELFEEWDSQPGAAGSAASLEEDPAVELLEMGLGQAD